MKFNKLFLVGIFISLSFFVFNEFKTVKQSKTLKLLDYELARFEASNSPGHRIEISNDLGADFLVIAAPYTSAIAVKENTPPNALTSNAATVIENETVANENYCLFLIKNGHIVSKLRLPSFVAARNPLYCKAFKGGITLEIVKLNRALRPIEINPVEKTENGVIAPR